MIRYTEKKLAEEIGKAVKEIDPGLRATYRRDRGSVAIARVEGSEEPPATLFLGNMFLNVRDLSRGEREDVILGTLRDLLAEDPPSPEALMASLTLRAQTPIGMRLRSRFVGLNSGRMPDPVTYGDGGSLLLELVADGQETVCSVDRSQLDEAEVDEDDAFRIAAARLARETDYEQWLQVGEGIWASSYRDGYDFARVLAADSDVRLPFPSRPIAFAPSQSVCLVTGSEDPAVLEEMIERGYDLAGDHRPFSSLLWTRTDGVWAQWAPGADEPGYRIAALQRLRELSACYQDQKAYLEQLFELHGMDGFVAGFHLFDGENGRESMASYVLNRPSYLPKADGVVLVDPEADEEESVVGVVPWQHFAEVLGPDRLTPMVGEQPVRYALTGAITQDQETALRELASPL